MNTAQHWGYKVSGTVISEQEQSKSAIFVAFPPFLSFSDSGLFHSKGKGSLKALRDAEYTAIDLSQREHFSCAQEEREAESNQQENWNKSQTNMPIPF